MTKISLFLDKKATLLNTGLVALPVVLVDQFMAWLSDNVKVHIVTPDEDPNYDPLLTLIELVEESDKLEIKEYQVIKNGKTVEILHNEIAAIATKDIINADCIYVLYTDGSVKKL